MLKQLNKLKIKITQKPYFKTGIIALKKTIGLFEVGVVGDMIVIVLSNKCYMLTLESPLGLQTLNCAVDSKFE